jgi:probable phosphoglycerate mutase
MSVSASDAEVGYPQRGFETPAGAVDMLLIRHGQSAEMAVTGYPRTANGQGDPELSAKGHGQAAALAERLVDAGIEAMYVTSLIRTQQTAAPLAARLGLTPVVVADLREVSLGDWEGGEFRRRMEHKDPLMLELLRSGRWSLAPGAESDEQFADRVRAGLLRIQAAHAGQRVAVVCHGGVIGQAIALASGCTPIAFAFSDNTSISQLVLHGEHWTVRRYNDTEHLGPAFTAATSEAVI